MRRVRGVAAAVFQHGMQRMQPDQLSARAAVQGSAGTAQPVVWCTEGCTAFVGRDLHTE